MSERVVEHLVLDAVLRGRASAKRALWRILMWYTKGRIRRVDAVLVRSAIVKYAKTYGYPIDEEEIKKIMRRIMKILRE